MKKKRICEADKKWVAEWTLYVWASIRKSLKPDSFLKGEDEEAQGWRKSS